MAVLRVASNLRNLLTLPYVFVFVAQFALK